MKRVVGVDSSTQSTKVVVVSAETGELLAAGSAAHPDGTAVDPRVWTSALQEAWAAGRVTDFGSSVLAASVAAQQHGMVALDHGNHPVFDALLWNDTRSAPEAERMVAELGAAEWAKRTGLVPVPSFTLTKLAWLSRQHPELAAQVARVCLPHDWLNLQLAGTFSTDRSDASGTGYFDPVGNTYLPELMQRYFGAVPELPTVLAPEQQAGRLLDEWGLPNAVLAAGAGDNAAAALGLGLAEGEVVLSVGTSGTVFSSSGTPTHDASGQIAGFADATGQYLPLLAMLNSARTLSATATMLQVDLAELDRLALAAPVDADGLLLLPYLDGERTPNLPTASGTLLGLRRSTMTPENLARAAVLAVLNSLADAVDLIKAAGVPVQRVLLIGGGSKSVALRQAAASVLGVDIEIPAAAEYVALGAARQAAWAATGELPQWKRRIEQRFAPEQSDWGAELRGRYQESRKAVYGV
ncbi:xylulokinase [Psychromicrobium lacuslunae]|uniref:Xylulose kinase n=1 Tax=Psychromicrobium lacuslunae TaxID=1618207 RepID=A0A0D4C1R6_9MICC|nr:xylulokinase [Psychromicrobium lacuslunae]AJT42311.1 xylulose kinase [Psychromicrobium lacuslunae]